MATKLAKTTKAAIGSLLAGSILLTAMPASAQMRGGWDRYDRRHDGISAGEVIAGAVVIGGLAAILSSGNNSRGSYDPRYDGRNDGRYDPRYDGRNDGRNSGYNDDWQRYGGSRQAISQCVSAVERQGGRGSNVDVTRITNVDRTRGGYRIEGQVAVDYRNGWRGDRNDGRYGYNDRDGRGYDRGRYDDRGSFSCSVRYGQIDDVRVRGI